MMIKVENITFFNTETEETYIGSFMYEFLAIDHWILNVQVNGMDIEVQGVNCFEALSKIREQLLPIEPMIVGTQKYIFPVRGYGWLNFYPNMELGKRYERKNKLLIFHPTKEKVFTPPKVQKAFIKLYQFSFVSSAFEKEYGLNSNIVVLEKEPAMKYEPNKSSNANYQYFWIYEKEKNLIYNIKNEEDIESFKKGKLLPGWLSLDDFIEWYADNCCPTKA